MRAVLLNTMKMLMIAGTLAVSLQASAQMNGSYNSRPVAPPAPPVYAPQPSQYIFVTTTHPTYVPPPPAPSYPPYSPPPVTAAPRSCGATPCTASAQ
jgi:hypothetical protein